MKVVWLCHFANQEMIAHFGVKKVREFAPWIGNLLLLFLAQKEIELHIVAPNVFNNKDTYFKKEGIHYHFFSVPAFVWPKKAQVLYRLIAGESYRRNQRKISNIIHEIRPDLIHLHGAENPYYSAGILPLLEKYKVLVTIQGFIRNTTHRNRAVRQRIRIEEEILKKARHFGVCTEEMAEIVRALNPNAELHFHDYPVTVPKCMKDNIGGNEPVDCIFFARVSKDKGIEDLLEAISIIKKNRPEVSLMVIGGAPDSYLTLLKNRCAEMDIANNVRFMGFVPSQEDIYRYALDAKLCVLPTYHDAVPGTIIESMFMKLPVVSYAVGGITELNRDKETVFLSEKGNVIKLAGLIDSVLTNSDIRSHFAENAFAFAGNRFKNSSSVSCLLHIYSHIEIIKTTEFSWVRSR